MLTDESVTSQTKAEIEISPSSDYTMKMDRDGDGVFEKKIKPDKIEIITLRGKKVNGFLLLLFTIVLLSSVIGIYLSRKDLEE